MIPKIIHYCWFSGDPYPEKIKSCVDSWKKNLAGYEFKLWNKHSFDIDSVLWVKEALIEKKYAFAADYIRLWALYNYGGIYLDSDVEVVQTFDSFLDLESFIGFEYIQIPEAAVIGARKNCEWIHDCLKYYENNSFYHKNGEPKQEVVPILIKNVLSMFYQIKIFDSGKIQKLSGLTIYPHIYFSPKNYFSQKIEFHKETIAIHRFANSWVDGKKSYIKIKIHYLFIVLFSKKIHDIFFYWFKKDLKKFNEQAL